MEFTNSPKTRGDHPVRCQDFWTSDGVQEDRRVLATKNAETSLTMPGVSHVIDGYLVKVKVHKADAGLDLLKVVRVSQAQAMQMTDRAGREKEGTCYRLKTAQEFFQLADAIVSVLVFALLVLSTSRGLILWRPPPLLLSGSSSC